MEGKMKVLRLNAPKDLEYTEAPIPHPGLNEVLCRVESTSICGTDPHIINGDFPGFWPKSFPLIPGHEWAGQVVELGQNAELYGWKVGDRVAGIANMGCGFCKNCLEGRWTICLNYGKPKIHKMYGHITPGAYAQYINVSIKSIGKIPDDMDYNLAACMDPLSIALHMVERSGLQCGEDVLVNGSGAQGIMAVLICKHLGAGRVFVSGSGHRLAQAAKLGGIPINYREEDVVKKVMEYTNGLGVMRVMECAGTKLGIQQAMDVVARGGCVSTISLPKEPVEVPVRKLVLDEIDFHGNRANPNTLSKAIALANAHREELGQLITHVYPMTEYKRAFEVFNGRLDNSLKVVVKPNEF